MASSMKWFAKHRETIVPLLVTFGLVLVFVNFVSYGILTASRLAANKDALDALSSSVNIVVLLIGSVFSYYRFFRGRTFFSRAEICVAVSVIDTTSDYYIHFVCVEIKNIGTLSIWNPQPIVEVYFEGPGENPPELWDKWREAAITPVIGEPYAVIDSGEVASFTNHYRVAKLVWAVGYVAFVRAESGELWKRGIMVPNVPSDKISPGTVMA